MEGKEMEFGLNLWNLRIIEDLLDVARFLEISLWILSGEEDHKKWNLGQNKSK